MCKCALLHEVMGDTVSRAVVSGAACSPCSHAHVSAYVWMWALFISPVTDWWPVLGEPQPRSVSAGIGCRPHRDPAQRGGGMANGRMDVHTVAQTRPVYYWLHRETDWQTERQTQTQFPPGHSLTSQLTNPYTQCLARGQSLTLKLCLSRSEADRLVLFGCGAGDVSAGYTHTHIHCVVTQQPFHRARPHNSPKHRATKSIVSTGPVHNMLWTSQ